MGTLAVGTLDGLILVGFLKSSDVDFDENSAFAGHRGDGPHYQPRPD
jgi:hypothetical protein